MKKMLLITTALLAVGFSAHAEEAQSQNVGQLNTSAFSYQQFKGFLGLGAGYTTSDSKTPAEGTPTTIKLLGSYYLPSNTAVFDLGLGLSNQQFSNKAAQDTASTATTLEAAARYQWLNKWQAGVVFNDFMNQGSNYFSRQADAHFAGLQVLKEIDLTQNYLVRVGARAMTETNPESRAVNMFLVDLHIGWGADHSATQFHTQETAAQKTEVATPAAATKLELSYLLNKRADKKAKKSELATFALAQDKIEKGDKVYLARLAKALKAHNNLYTSMVVKGYADKSGSDAANLEISKKRAEKVSSLLQKEIGSQNIQAIGLGSAFSKKAKNASDRKVEIEFVGVNNEAELKKVIESVHN